ncbi:hypothetical protein RI129_013255 [Pyrocoelia pectoralis]|uniref:THAP-type domain-containing protein n=1 Tax=Pyrocoelia pectoralis TaxID=417401 RepID=A0AAN7Z7L1_9COLE
MDDPAVKYKNKCCVPGCTDKLSKRHRFPKNLKYFNEWVRNIKLQELQEKDVLSVYLKYYVCNKHFENNYLVPGTRRGLRKDAIPTLYLSGRYCSELYCLNF